MAFVLTGLLAFAPAASHAAWPHDPNVNVPINTATSYQQAPAIVPDGAGGAIVAWQDHRNGIDFDIYAQHVLASGVVDGAWPPAGLAVCTAFNNQNTLTMIADGTGGAIVTWHDTRGANGDIYAQHVLASGAVDGAWPVNGRAVCTAANFQYEPTIVSDGAGGAIITWYDYRSGAQSDIFAQHVLASGALDGAWPVNGQAICSATSSQSSPACVTDGAGGAIIAWQDPRTGGINDVYAQRVLNSGIVDPAWPANGVALCAAAGEQFGLNIVSDGAGGAIVAWRDFRNGTSDIYAQHVVSSGVVDPAWLANGQPVCTAAGDQVVTGIVSDGAGGAIATWWDVRSGTYDIYAQRLLVSGVVDGAWPADGRALCTATDIQYLPRIVADGSGGAIVTWQDSRSGSSSDIYAQHVLASGVVDGTWPTDGRALSTAANNQSAAAITTDGAGGAIVAFEDARNGLTDIYAQKVGALGYLGAEPDLVSVRDVPNDNGGKVKVSWTASYLDTEVPYVVDHYWVFRSAPPSAAQQAIAEGARLLETSGAAPLPGERAFLTTIESAATTYWEFVTSQPATHFASAYSYTAATTNDSMAAGNPQTAFIVVAYNSGNTLYFISNSRSGYSVDNLPPVLPGPLAASFADGAVRLTWEPSADGDLDHYELHRGASADFVPGPENLVGSPRAPEYLDTGPPGSAYKLSAVDTHGNRSDWVVLAPQIEAVPPGAPSELALGPPSPNPTAQTIAMRLALPRQARVSLAVHDLAGRTVKRLLEGVASAGERDLTWDLRDAGGARAADGIYFLALDVEGRRITRRLVVVH